MTLRRRYEKRLWSLILENDGSAPEVNAETLKAKLEKIAQKIKDSGLVSTMSGAFSGLEKTISSMKGSIDMRAAQGKEHSILRDIKDEFTNTSKGFYKKYEDVVKDNAMYENPNLNHINLTYVGLIANVDGKQVYKEGDRVGQSSDFLEKIKANVIKSAKKYTAYKEQEKIDELKKDFDDIVKPWIEYLKDVSEVGPEPSAVDDAIDAFDKKINAVVKAYGTWLAKNKEAIGEIMKALQDDDSGDKPRSQTAGYRRLGNTLFERFLMSGGLK